MKAAGEEGMEGVSAFEAYVHRAFAPDGLFSRARDFEYRAEQQSMALAVARALQVAGGGRHRRGQVPGVFAAGGEVCFGF